jgi:hypothetical protein
MSRSHQAIDQRRFKKRLASRRRRTPVLEQILTGTRGDLGPAPGGSALTDGKDGVPMAGAETSEIGEEPVTREEPVSREHLCQMRATVGAATLRLYTQAYLDLLPERLDRIGQALSADNTVEAEHVIVDLQVSSEMLGARRLAAKLTALESSLHAGLMPSSVQLASVRTEAELVAETVRAAGVRRGLR